jgi:predicted PurR-regulated permease PerM
MANPLFQALGGGQMSGPMGQFQHMMQQFQQFKANFQGDPQQEVQKLLQSGKITQQQLDQIQQMAKQFQTMVK